MISLSPTPKKNIFWRHFWLASGHLTRKCSCLVTVGKKIQVIIVKQTCQGTVSALYTLGSGLSTLCSRYGAGIETGTRTGTAKIVTVPQHCLKNANKYFWSVFLTHLKRQRAGTSRVNSRPQALLHHRQALKIKKYIFSLNQGLSVFEPETATILKRRKEIRRYGLN
jgi:hypothetical protein